MDSPSLAPGENLVFRSDRVRAAMAHSSPTHRGTAALPLIQDLALFVTDRRVVVRAELFLGLFDSDFCAWFPGAERQGSGDWLERARIESETLLGPCLVLETRGSGAMVLRSERLALRLFLPEAAQAWSALPPALRAA